MLGGAARAGGVEESGHDGWGHLWNRLESGATRIPLPTCDEFILFLRSRRGGGELAKGGNGLQVGRVVEFG